jgi:hypothetical protein
MDPAGKEISSFLIDSIWGSIVSVFSSDLEREVFMVILASKAVW